MNVAAAEGAEGTGWVGPGLCPPRAPSPVATGNKSAGPRWERIQPSPVPWEHIKINKSRGWREGTGARSTPPARSQGDPTKLPPPNCSPLLWERETNACLVQGPQNTHRLGTRDNTPFDDILDDISSISKGTRNLL